VIKLTNNASYFYKEPCHWFLLFRLFVTRSKPCRKHQTIQKGANYSKSLFGWLLFSFIVVEMGFVYIIFCICLFWINKPVAIVNKHDGTGARIVETWRTLQLIGRLSHRTESVKTFISKEFLWNLEKHQSPCQLLPTANTVQFSKSPKATVRRRNVMITSPPFNLVRVDFNPNVYWDWMPIADLCK